MREYRRIIENIKEATIKVKELEKNGKSVKGAKASDGCKEKKVADSRKRVE